MCLDKFFAFAPLTHGATRSDLLVPHVVRTLNAAYGLRKTRALVYFRHLNPIGHRPTDVAMEHEHVMGQDTLDIAALLDAMAESPRRDNSAYHAAMAEARRAFEDAEAALGGPVKVKIKTKTKRNGSYVVKWTFKRLA